MIFETKLKLFSIGIVTISEETISLLSVGMLKIKFNEKIESKQGTSYQGAT